jgi:sRNA-binding carbon storage regulator CsrA
MAICFNRYPGQTLVVGDVQIDVVETHRSYCKLRVHAPDGLLILRGELAATLPAPPPAPPPTEPRTGNPSRVAAASAPAAGAVCEAPPAAGGAGAEGTQGGAPPRRRVLSPPPLKRPKHRR